MTSSRSAYNMKRVSMDRPYGTMIPECHLYHGTTEPSPPSGGNSACDPQDLSGNNNGNTAKQPMTPVNPFDATPKDVRSSSTCASSAKSKCSSSSSRSSSISSINSSRSSKSSICNRRQGLNRNTNENQNVNNNNDHRYEPQQKANVDVHQGHDVINVSHDCIDTTKFLCTPSVAVGAVTTTNSGPTSSRCDIDNDKAHKDSSMAQQIVVPDTRKCNDFLPQLGMAKTCIDKTDLHGKVRPQNEHLTPGYGTYKIIGGRQYREWPEVDPRVNMKLPTPLAEYQEYQRRCPCPRLGRYDRRDVDNEMILPCHKTSTLIKASLSPFTYMRNPKVWRNRNDQWSSLDIGKLGHQKRGAKQLKWALPTFI